MNLTPAEEVVPLAPQAFHILLALAEKPMYGYGISQQCAADAETSVYFDKGSVYRTLRRLLKLRYVEATFEEAGAGSIHMRKYYSLTYRGELVLEFECNRYRQASILGHHRLLKLKQPQEAPTL